MFLSIPVFHCVFIYLTRFRFTHFHLYTDLNSQLPPAPASIVFVEEDCLLPLYPGGIQLYIIPCSIYHVSSELFDSNHLIFYSFLTQANPRFVWTSITLSVDFTGNVVCVSREKIK